MVNMGTIPMLLNIKNVNMYIHMYSTIVTTLLGLWIASLMIPLKFYILKRWERDDIIIFSVLCCHIHTHPNSPSYPNSWSLTGVLSFVLTSFSASVDIFSSIVTLELFTQIMLLLQILKLTKAAFHRLMVVGYRHGRGGKCPIKAMIPP